MRKTNSTIPLLAVSDSNSQPFLALAAQHAFWKVEKSQLVALAKLKNVNLPRAATTFHVVCALIKALLQGTTDVA